MVPEMVAFSVSEPVSATFWTRVDTERYCSGVNGVSQAVRFRLCTGWPDTKPRRGPRNRSCIALASRRGRSCT